jgi:2',3'-cyclic-nucleotide 2'-phosphodiesterase/3'-nucleotidase
MVTMSLPTRRQLLASAPLLAAPALATPAATPATLKLRLLATSDLHCFLEAYDYYRDTPDDTVGLTRIATLIHTARAEAPNTLLLDNGDLIQGNPLADFMAEPNDLASGALHPSIKALNLLGYDAATLGNHEFNYGVPYLSRVLSGATYPYCSANYLDDQGAPILPPTLILQRTFTAEDGSKVPLKIGIIGFLPPQITDWDRDNLSGRVMSTDIVEAAQRFLPDLRAAADLVIALSHSGISTAPRQGGEENASLYLSRVPGLDAIITGHSHRVFPGDDYESGNGVDATNGTLNGIPAIMPGFWGSELGIIDLTLTNAGGKWAVASFTTGTRPISQRSGQTVTALTTDDTALDNAIAADHQRTLAWIREPIGTLTTPVDSYGALIGTDPSLALVNAAQLWYATPLLPASVRGLPVLSAAAPFKEGYQNPDNYIDLHAGTIAIKDVADLYIYPNTVAAVQVSGTRLKSWLEKSAEIFNQIDPGNPAPQWLLHKHVPSYIFDVIAGLTYQIDLTKPEYRDDPSAGGRIINLAYQGEAIAPDQEFVVITNNYRADSGFADTPDAVVLRAPDQVRDVLARYILTNRTISVAVPEVWSFAPLGAPVTVVFESSPAAQASLTRRPGISVLGDSADGYTLFALALT